MLFDRYDVSWLRPKSKSLRSNGGSPTAVEPLETHPCNSHAISRQGQSLRLFSKRKELTSTKCLGVGQATLQAEQYCWSWNRRMWSSTSAAERNLLLVKSLLQGTHGTFAALAVSRLVASAIGVDDTREGKLEDSIFGSMADALGVRRVLLATYAYQTVSMGPGRPWAFAASKAQEVYFVLSPGLSVPFGG